MRFGGLIVASACAALMIPGVASAGPEEPVSVFAALFDGFEDSAPASEAASGGENEAASSGEKVAEVEVAQASRKNGTWNKPQTNSGSAPAPARAPASSGGGSFFDFFGSSSGGVPSQYRRQSVRYESNYKPGTIIIDTANRFLYHVQEGGVATRYGVGVGRQGFSWKGAAYIGDKKEWPGWTPPAEMRKREPWLPAHMPGGPNNPLGARALYLYQGGADTLYRIHGTNQPETIGQAVSSGCIRMLNDDVVFLYEQVRRGARVVVI